MIFGLTCTTYTATPVIKEVLPDSAAAASGLEVGDRIQKIDGKTIHIIFLCNNKVSEFMCNNKNTQKYYGNQ